MSQQLTQLGYDLSSFYNVAVEEAMQKLKSGFAGELEPLRNLGYDLSQAKLEAIALSLGIDKSVSSMTQAEKAQLRYYAVMTQVTQVQGDMARTLNDPANQLRIFQAQLQMAARSLGNIFIPALNAVLPYAIAVAKVIRLLADAIAGLFGFTFPEMDTSAMTNLETGAGGASDAIDQAAGSASKLKKTLLGIDELNVMSDTSGSGSGSGADTSGGGFDFEIPTYDFIGEATNSRVNQIVEEMKEWLGITGEIDSWSDFFHTKLGAILLTVGAIGVAFASWKIGGAITSLSAFVKDADKLKSLASTAKMASSVFLTLAGGVTLVVSAFDAFNNGIDWGNLLGMLGGMGAVVGGLAISFGATGAAIGLLVGGLALFVTGINDALNGSKSLETALAIITGILAIGGGIAILVGGWIPLLVAGIAAAVAMVVMYWDQIVAWVSNAVSVIGQFFTDLWNGIVSVWNNVATWFDTNVIQPVVGFFAGLWEGISTAASDCWNAIVAFFTPAFEWFSALFGSIWQTISDIFYNIGVIASGCWEIIKAVWGVVSQWFNTYIIQPVSTFFTNLWNGISTAATNAWNGIKSVFSVISGWINDTIIQPVSRFFTGLWDGFLNKARAAWDGVKAVFSKVASFFSDTFQKAWSGVVKIFSVAGDIFVDIKDGILTAFKSIVNGLIKGVNSVIAVPFNGINWVLKMIRDINIMGIMPFGGIQLISVPQIPYLAQGGVVADGQMFVANEAGPELVGNVGRKTVVMNNDQIVESVSRGVYQAVVAAMGSSRGDQVVEAKVNDKVLFEVMVSRARQETVRTGHNPLLGGV
jgi:phage-related protein